MIDCKVCHLRKIERKDFPFILSWYKSQNVASGFHNPQFGFYDIQSIENMYNMVDQKVITFIVVGPKGNIPLGAILINVEWENRNGIIDIMMSARGGTAGMGFVALTEVIKYCKAELNLRRIEVKISTSNTVMVKLFRFFPKDEKSITEIYKGSAEIDLKIIEHAGISIEEFQNNPLKYKEKYIREVLFKDPKPDLTLKNHIYSNGKYIDFYLSSFILPECTDDIENILLLSSGDFTKSTAYKMAKEKGVI